MLTWCLRVVVLAALVGASSQRAWASLAVQTEAPPPPVVVDAPEVTPGPTILSGRVFRETDGSPVVGATVRCQRPVKIRFCATGWQYEVASSFDERITDEQGRFRFEFEGQLGLHSTVVMPTHDTGLAPVSLARNPRVGSGALLAGGEADVEVSAPPALPFTGTTVDEEGAPIAGVQLSIWHVVKAFDEARQPTAPDVVVHSDAQGRFALPSIGPGAQVEIEADGYLPQGLLQLNHRDTQDFDDVSLVLHPERFFEGHVRSPTGERLAGAKVRVTRDLIRPDPLRNVRPGLRFVPITRLFTSTDASGSFRLGPLPSAEFDVSVSAPQLQGWARRVIPGGAALDVQLSEGATLGGVVHDAQGNPVAEATVIATTPSTRDAPQFGRRAEPLGADGSYEIKGIPDTHALKLTVRAPGFATQFIDRVSIDATNELRLDVQLEPAVTLDLRVVDHDGEPLRSKDVWVRGERVLAGQHEPIDVWTDQGFAHRSWDTDLRRGLARTDRSGRARVEDLVAGRYWIAVGNPYEVFSVEPQHGPVELKLRAPDDLRRRFTGHVTDELTGLPIEDYEVSATPTCRRVPVDAPIQRDGAQFTIDLGCDFVRVRVTAPGRAAWTWSVPSQLRGDLNHQVQLAPAINARLRVVTAEGTPVPEASLSFTRRDREQAVEVAGKWVWGPVRSDATGELAVERLPRAPLVLIVSGTHPTLGKYRRVIQDLDLSDLADGAEVELVLR
ncbi:MAG: hypothetical protein DHS20C15_31230 [Planctomycetota bacterium]|nr:MAG: hypothetical protein DHS20C15_31230 [Planctomycetota bacterium]